MGLGHTLISLFYHKPLFKDPTSTGSPMLKTWGLGVLGGGYNFTHHSRT